MRGEWVDSLDIDGTRALLREWGRCVRTEEMPIPGLSYPAQSAGVTGRPDPFLRQSEKAKNKRLSLAAKRMKRRMVYMGEDAKGNKRYAAAIGIPLSQPHDSRTTRPRAPKYEPWPVEIRRVHMSFELLDLDEQRVLVAKYVLDMGRPMATKELEITDSRYRETLARAEGVIRGYLHSAAA